MKNDYIKKDDEQHNNKNKRKRINPGIFIDDIR